MLVWLSLNSVDAFTSMDTMLSQESINFNLLGMLEVDVIWHNLIITDEPVVWGTKIALT